MNFKFEKLTTDHFPLLLKWLKAEHVSKWWDPDINWTMELIREKYGSYVLGYKLQDGKNKQFNAYIIYADQTPIGYTQVYNAYDFPRSVPLTSLPPSLAAFDIFIGETSYIGKNIGSTVIQLFLDQYAAPYFEYTFADPDIDNIAAIKSYSKAGFKPIKADNAAHELFMLRKNASTRKEK